MSPTSRHVTGFLFLSSLSYHEDMLTLLIVGKSLPVRVYTTKGLKDQGKLALESAHQIVDYFSEVRAVSFPTISVENYERMP